MTMATALVAAALMVAVVIVGITMVVMDSAVVLAVCAVVPLGHRLMVQMVSALAWFPGIFLNLLQASCAWTSSSAHSWTFVL